MANLITKKDRALIYQDEIIKHLTIMGNSRYEIGRIFKICLDEQLYIDLGHQTPEDWVKKAFGIGMGACQQLVRIEEKFIECNISNEVKKQIDWTKAREIIKVMTPANSGEWIEKAKKMTVLELKNDIINEMIIKNTQHNKPIGFIYIPYYDENQKLTMFEAMELAAKMTASGRKEVQFMAMCQEFLGTYNAYGDMIDDPIRRAIYERDGYKCQSCGSRKNLSPHEIIPRGRGGVMNLENSITTCISCHNDITNEKMRVEKLGDGRYRFIKRNED